MKAKQFVFSKLVNVNLTNTLQDVDRIMKVMMLEHLMEYLQR